MDNLIVKIIQFMKQYSESSNISDALMQERLKRFLNEYKDILKKEIKEELSREIIQEIIGTVKKLKN
jgi:hypothetical protein